MLNSRRTLMYVQSVFDDSVRAPHTRMPRVPNGRMQLIADRVEQALLGLGDVHLDVERTAHDLVGRRLPDAAGVVGAGPDAGHVTARRDEDLDVAVGGGRVVDLDPRVVQRGELRVVHRRRRCATP